MKPVGFEGRGGGDFDLMGLGRSITDGVVVVRPFTSADRPALIAGRDAEWERFLGPGDEDPAPLACIVVDGEVVGWVDHDSWRPWLEPGEVNVGYNVFAPHRGRGLASRAVQLLLHHMAVEAAATTATLLIHPDNERSLALARRNRFRPHGDLDGNPYFKRPVPPPTYSDGVVTIRRRSIDDLERDLEAKDDEQIRWSWLPGQREAWEAMAPSARRAHARAGLQADHDAFGSGPRWCFSVDAGAETGVAYVDCDLANEHVPAGEANISYAAHPAHRGRGHVSRAVRLLLRFLRDHTGAREAHILVDRDDHSSARVAAAVGASERERWATDVDRTMVRHVVDVHAAGASDPATEGPRPFSGG